MLEMNDAVNPRHNVSNNNSNSSKSIEKKVWISSGLPVIRNTNANSAGAETTRMSSVLYLQQEMAAPFSIWG